MASQLPTDASKAVIEIQYDLTMEDYIAFNLDFAERTFLGKLSRTITYALAISVWLGIPLWIVGFLLIGGLEEFPEEDAPAVLAFLVFMAVGFFVLFPVIMYFALPRVGRSGWFTRWWIKQIVSEGKSGNLIGRYRVRVTPTAITEWSPAAVTEVRVSSIDRLIVSADHAFVYTSPVQAVIVPRRAFADASTFEQLVRTIEQNAQAAAIRSR